MAGLGVDILLEEGLGGIELWLVARRFFEIWENTVFFEKSENKPKRVPTKYSE